MRKRNYTESETGIDFTAILDIAFVVMVLFFGTTFFLVESGQENVDGPVTSMSHQEAFGQEPFVPPIELQINAVNLITIDGRLHERAVIMENLGRLKAERPDAALNIHVHPDARTEVLAEVVDAARVLGIEMVSVETGEDS